MRSPLLQQHEKQVPNQKFLQPPEMSSSMIAFFLFPIKYLLIHNKKVQESKKLGKKLIVNDFEDLPPLLKLNQAVDDDIEAQCDRMEKIWQKSQYDLKPINLYRLFYQTIPAQIHMTFISLAFNAASRLLYSFLMGATISCLSRYFYATTVKGAQLDSTFIGELRMETFYTSISMIVVILCYIYAERLFYTLSIQTGMKLRIICVMLLYRKLHRISLSALNEVSLGKFLNIISSDLSLLDHGLINYSAVFVAPFMLVFGIAMMWRNFGVLSLLSIGVIFLYMPVQSFIVKLSEAAKKRKNKLADDRLKIMGEIIESIRTLKQYTWEQIFMKLALSIRVEEDKAQTSILRVRSVTTSLSKTSIYVSLLITMYLILYISYISYFYSVVGGNDLTADKVFSSILILSILRAWCVVRFSEGIHFVVNFGLAQKRVIDILTIKEIYNPKTAKDLSSQIIEMEDITLRPIQDEQPSLCFTNYSGYWSKNTQTLNKPVLKNLNINMTHSLSASKLTCIIGKIGSGKSSLLLSILQEIPYNQGEVRVRGSIAYVEQEPFVFQGTIRDNILFGSEYDANTYDQVMKVSCFQDDLRALPEGDLSYVGERGITLSGGQRARLSFARALYSNSDIYILDDPLAAVDAKVARSMFTLGIKQYLRGKIVILVTHHIHFAVDSNWLVVMHEGEVREQGTPTDVLNALGQDFQQYIENTAIQRYSLTLKSDDPQMNQVLSRLSNTLSVQSDDKIDEQEIQVEQVKIQKLTVEDKQVFSDMQHEVTLKTLLDYISFGGGVSGFVKIYLLFASESLANILVNRLFGFWARDNEDKINNINTNSKMDHMFYFKMVVTLIVVISSLVYFNYLRLQLTILRIASNIYKKMVEVIIRARVDYFDRTASGQIISRFTTDLIVADTFLSYFLQVNMDGVTSLFLITLTVCLVNPIIFLPSVIFFFVLYKIKQIFQAYLAYTRNCDSATKGPLNTEIASTLNGLIVIRAYSKADQFIAKFQRMVFKNTQALMGFSRIGVSLALILDLALFMQITFGIALLIYMALTQSGDGAGDPGRLGFSLLLLIQIGDNFSIVLRSFFLIEINMGHVERMLALTQVESEAPLQQIADMQQIQNWPKCGDIEFRNVSMKYDLMRSEVGDKMALRQLNFRVPSGCKLGIVGRTGAGKSSLLQALFRMVEIEPGRPHDGIFIDNTNINQFGLHFLRRRISIIPQQPVVFQGTIRRNLDPLDIFRDESILDALNEVGLKDKILKLDHQLQTDMTISASVFSVGQKQLICLARAMLQDNKIVVFDEATSNVDLKTDQFIQTKIKQRFRDCTVLTIAHRLETIADYDRILVMDQGQLAEYDHPFKLLILRDTDEGITNMNGIFASMVLHTGKVTSKKIFKIAQLAFMQKLTQ